ncbi:hypothetical protein QT894_12495 [Xanthomonas fragariae]|nr:hypothetical protein [Xanthomonas fragariae]AOD13944.1 hypothetical protein BER92_03395 [Xanthomonas fragariae]AOD17331.1 hypothetical protein BER93_03395 [Xanthomonas fragariae]MDM7573099.1 hypothetical protein [Xanthomonas fragariae]
MHRATEAQRLIVAELAAAKGVAANLVEVVIQTLFQIDERLPAFAIGRPVHRVHEGRRWRFRGGKLCDEGQQQYDEQTREPGHGDSRTMDEPVACTAVLVVMIGDLLAMNAGYAALDRQNIAHSVSLQRNSRTRRIVFHTQLTPRSYPHGP